MSRWFSIGCLLIIGCAPKNYDESYYSNKRFEGARAFKLNISPEANPYRGNDNTPRAAKAWLDGYMDAKESSQ